MTKKLKMITENKSAGIVRAFAQCHGIPNLALGNAGAAGVRLQDGMELYLERVAQPEKLFIYLNLGHLPSKPEERLAYLERMLSLNCLEQGTLCGTLAVDALTDEVLLQAGMAEAELSVARLEQTAQALLLHRSRLLDELRRFEDARPMPIKATGLQLKRRLIAGGVQ